MKTPASILASISLVFIFFNYSYAGSVSELISANTTIKLCIDKNCKNPYKIKITHACWSDVKGIFSAPFTTDKDEQDNIVSAIALIEYDIYHSLAQQIAQKKSADDLYVTNTVKNDFRNIKNILGILLDSRLVKQHFMRKTIINKNWLGIENTGLLLQSLSNSKLYVLESHSRNLGESAAIIPYKDTSASSAGDTDKTSNTLKNEDFE